MYTEKQIEFVRRQAEAKTSFTLHDSAVYSSAYGKIVAGREAEMTKEELAFLQTLWKVSDASFSKERGELTADVSAKAEALSVKP